MFSTHPHCKYINAETWLLNIIYSMACPGVTCHQECQEEASHKVPGSSAHELKAGGALGKTPRLTSSSQSSAQTSLLHHITCEHTQSPIFSSLPALKRLHLFERYTHFYGMEGKDTSDEEVLLNFSCKVEPTRKEIRSEFPLKKYIL